ncbi:MAG: Holliday junction resolvase RuvX [Candidatus Margulisbacteria bacterium]|nr:Holliday junction resolvase RuvX [Candidatus Margulisiibacteriota bacterium]
MKILGLDYGTKYIGIALSDPFKSIAFPYGKIEPEKAMAKIKEILEEENIESIVLGLPRALKGNETAMTGLVKLFKTELEKHVTIPIHFQDERLTSSFVGKQLTAQGVNQKKQRQIKDALEATQILQSFLDKN